MPADASAAGRHGEAARLGEVDVAGRPDPHRMPTPPPVAYEQSLGRLARSGSWAELAKGTFRAAAEKLDIGDGESAASLLHVSLLEAEELHDAYHRWPAECGAWILQNGAPKQALDAAVDRLRHKIGDRAMDGIRRAWPQYVAAVDTAATLCLSSPAAAREAIEKARSTWQEIHDDAVDLLSGMIDIAARLLGEDAIPALWGHLMRDWYDSHCARYDLGHQPWAASADQLMIAIVDGFHAHLAGVERQGDIEMLEEPDRVGFRFAPCGSGGRSVDPRITDGRPLAGPPFDFAVTTRPHDWAWNTVGICSYCVHCCLLNEVEPIDRLGYPTRVIDAPTWPAGEQGASCTWWVYRDPRLVPDSVYRRVGRERPTPPTEGQKLHD